MGGKILKGLYYLLILLAALLPGCKSTAPTLTPTPTPTLTPEVPRSSKPTVITIVPAVPTVPTVIPPTPISAPREFPEIDVYIFVDNSDSVMEDERRKSFVQEMCQDFVELFGRDELTGIRLYLYKFASKGGVKDAEEVQTCQQALSESVGIDGVKGLEIVKNKLESKEESVKSALELSPKEAPLIFGVYITDGLYGKNQEPRESKFEESGLFNLFVVALQYDTTNPKVSYWKEWEIYRQAFVVNTKSAQGTYSEFSNTFIRFLYKVEFWYKKVEKEEKEEAFRSIPPEVDYVLWRVQDQIFWIGINEPEVLSPFYRVIYNVRFQDSLYLLVYRDYQGKFYLGFEVYPRRWCSLLQNEMRGDLRVIEGSFIQIDNTYRISLNQPVSDIIEQFKDLGFVFMKEPYLVRGWSLYLEGKDGEKQKISLNLPREDMSLDFLLSKTVFQELKSNVALCKKWKLEWKINGIALSTSAKKQLGLDCYKLKFDRAVLEVWLSNGEEEDEYKFQIKLTPEAECQEGVRYLERVGTLLRAKIEVERVSGGSGYIRCDSRRATSISAKTKFTVDDYGNIIASFSCFGTLSLDLRSFNVNFVDLSPAEIYEFQCNSIKNRCQCYNC